MDSRRLIGCLIPHGFRYSGSPYYSPTRRSYLISCRHSVPDTTTLQCHSWLYTDPHGWFLDPPERLLVLDILLQPHTYTPGYSSCCWFSYHSCPLDYVHHVPWVYTQLDYYTLPHTTHDFRYTFAGFSLHIHTYTHHVVFLGFDVSHSPLWHLFPPTFPPTLYFALVRRHPTTTEPIG